MATKRKAKAVQAPESSAQEWRASRVTSVKNRGYQESYRQRKLDAGLVQAGPFWIRPESKAKLKAYVKRLA